MAPHVYACVGKAAALALAGRATGTLQSGRENANVESRDEGEATLHHLLWIEGRAAAVAREAWAIRAGLAPPDPVIVARLYAEAAHLTHDVAVVRLREQLRVPRWRRVLRALLTGALRWL